MNIIKTAAELIENDFKSIPTSEQRYVQFTARLIRDVKDTVTILKALAAHNPFSLDTNNNLRNITNAVTADSNYINADTA